MFENPRRGRKARNFTTNVPKILDLKSSQCRLPNRYFPTIDVVAPDFKNGWISSEFIFFAPTGKR